MLIECSALGVFVVAVAAAYSRKRKSADDEEDESDDGGQNDGHQVNNKHTEGDASLIVHEGKSAASEEKPAAGEGKPAAGEGKPAAGEGKPAAPQALPAGEKVTFYNAIASSTFLAQPGKCRALMNSIPGATLQQFSDEVSAKATRELVAELLEHATQVQLSNVVAPALSGSKLRPSAVALCKAGALDMARILPAIRKIPPENVFALLRAPPEVLVGIASGLNPGRFHAIALPILQEPVAFTTMYILPVLGRIRQPELVGKLLNRAEPKVIMAFIHKTPTQRLAATLNSLEKEDVDPGSNLLQLLDQAAASPELLQGVLIPWVKQADPVKSLMLVRGAEVDRLLQFLFRVNTEDIARLLDHANLEFIVRTLNGPLGEMEGTLANMASGVGYVLRSRVGTKTVQASSNGCNVGLTKVGTLIKEIGKPAGEQGSYDWVY